MSPDEFYDRCIERADAATRFTVTDRHLALLRRTYIGWNETEFGAPSIEPKRPYGSGDVLRDLREIGAEWAPEVDMETEENERYLVRLHAELLPVLRIVLSVGEFVPGTYTRAPYDRQWKRVAA